MGLIHDNTKVYKYILKETKILINYRCDVCGDKLIGNDRLWIHRKKRHPDLAVICRNRNICLKFDINYISNLDYTLESVSQTVGCRPLYSSNGL